MTQIVLVQLRHGHASRFVPELPAPRSIDLNPVNLGSRFDT